MTTNSTLSLSRPLLFEIAWEVANKGRFYFNVQWVEFTQSSNPKHPLPVKNMEIDIVLLGQ